MVWGTLPQHTHVKHEKRAKNHIPMASCRFLRKSTFGGPRKILTFFEFADFYICYSTFHAKPPSWVLNLWHAAVGRHGPPKFPKLSIFVNFKRRRSKDRIFCSVKGITEKFGRYILDIVLHGHSVKSPNRCYRMPQVPQMKKLENFDTGIITFWPFLQLNRSVP